MAVSIEQAIFALRNLLEENGFRYNFDENRNAISLNFSLDKSKLASVRILIRVVPSQTDPDNCFRITSFGVIGIKADEDSIAEMAEFLHRANYGMIFGCFELDYDDGEIRFRISLNCNDGLPGPSVLEDLWDLPAMMAERYGNGIIAVSMGMLSAEEAIKRIEGE